MSNNRSLSDENLEKREKLWAWLALPQRRRGMRVKEKLAESGITHGQYTIWKRDYQVMVASEHVRREMQARAKMENAIYSDPKYQEVAKTAQENTGRWTIDDIEEDPEGWWKRRTLELNQAILQSAKRGNAQSQKLAKQLAGELVEKSEVKVGWTPEEIYRRHLEEQQQLAEFRARLGIGIEEMPE